ncbi:MAG: hypothetical protein MJ078_00215 [Clostridia bacterium]|nr:hypothetical protein [Clostridia bacterium]
MKPLSYSFTRQRLFPGFDGKTCKICPAVMSDGKDTAVLCYQMLLLTGDDVTVDSYSSVSRDGGKTFGTPRPLSSADKTVNGIRHVKTFSCPYYNRFHRKWLMLGLETLYENDKEPVCVGGISVCQPYYTSYSPEKGDWDANGFSPIPLPVEALSAIPHGQVIEFENGDMLLSFFVSFEGFPKAGVLTVRYAYTENGLKPVKQGTVLRADQYARGLCEPSVARLGNKYYMTLRTDEAGLWSESDDGYTFSAPVPWQWDNGEVLENYNTMQRWIRHPDGLYLAYTRKGAHNDHVFRHRAPIFMARFDEDRKCLLRDTEVILVPEIGARLGNFFVTDVSKTESLLSVAEWMQPVGCEKYGSDNSIWIARVNFTE